MECYLNDKILRESGKNFGALFEKNTKKVFANDNGRKYLEFIKPLQTIRQ